MDPTLRFAHNIRFDLVYKVILILSTGWAAYLHSSSVGIEIFLFLLAILLSTLFYYQRKNLNRIQSWLVNQPDNLDEKLLFLQKESHRSLLNSSLSNPILLVVYFLIFSYYQFGQLPHLTWGDCVTYGAFAVFAFSLSFFMGKGLINALHITLRMQEGLHKKEDIERHKKRVRQKQIVRIFWLLALLGALLIVSFL